MRRVRMTNFLRGLILIGVAFAFLSSFDWFRTLLRNLFIGTVSVVGIVLVWYSYKLYRRLKER